MADFGWWNQRIHQESGGTRWMCCLCFEAVLMEDLYRAPNGNVWDMCKACQAKDEEAARRREAGQHMACQTCGNPTEIGKLNRINPPPFDELIVCDHCYEWYAWEFVKYRENP